MEQTTNAISNFGKDKLPQELIRAYAEVKKACLTAIQETESKYKPEIFECILKSIDDLINKGFHEQFPLSLFQGGAGTSINMNLNEVISSLAMKYLKEKKIKKVKIDPIEDINRYQSTNDTFPTAVTIIVYRKLIELEKKIILLQEKLIIKERELSSVLITGRTEMQDALPITLGQVFAGWAGCIERDRWRINKLKDRVRTIALGGTAIGTCFFAPIDYIYSAEKNLRQITGLPLSRSQNLTDEISNQDKLSEVANCIKLIAENLFKISSDLLIYTSGFVNEIMLPHLQYGSTIMPAKINPVILEYVHGLSIDVKHECHKISEYAQSGQLQLNPYLPFMLISLLKAFENIEKAIVSFMEKFINNLTVNKKAIEKNLIKSNVLLNSLIPELGYNKIKELYKSIEELNFETAEDLRVYLLKKGIMTKEKLDKLLHTFYLTGALKE